MENEGCWSRIQERVRNLTQLPSSRHLPSTRTILITAGVLVLATVILTATALGIRTRSQSLSGRPVFHASIHEGISEYTGGNGNDYWQYCSFRANRSITAVNLGICGPPAGGHYKIRLKLVEEYEESDLNYEPTALGETEAPTYAEEGSVYYVHFREPVQIKADTWYRAYVHISEGPPHTYYGTQGRKEEDVSCGEACAVNFQYIHLDGQPYSIGFQV